MPKTEKTEKFITLSEAEKITGYAQGHLNFLSRTGKLKAKKIGRNWHTTVEWINEFIEKNKVNKTEEDFITLQEAADTSGYSRVHLNLLARIGILKSKKIGRNWRTSKLWLEEMIRSRKEKRKKSAEKIISQNEKKELVPITNVSKTFSKSEVENLFEKLIEIKNDKIETPKFFSEFSKILRGLSRWRNLRR
jgi:hypothetical protein